MLGSLFSTIHDESDSYPQFFCSSFTYWAIFAVQQPYTVKINEDMVVGSVVKARFLNFQIREKPRNFFFVKNFAVSDSEAGFLSVVWCSSGRNKTRCTFGNYLSHSENPFNKSKTVVQGVSTTCVFFSPLLISDVSPKRKREVSVA